MGEDFLGRKVLDYDERSLGCEPNSKSFRPGKVDTEPLPPRGVLREGETYHHNYHESNPMLITSEKNERERERAHVLDRELKRMLLSLNHQLVIIFLHFNFFL